MVAERDQLAARVASLRAFIASDKFREVDRAERARLIRQETIMTEYVSVLSDRIEAFTLSAQAAQDDFQLGKACDLSGEGNCEACQ